MKIVSLMLFRFVEGQVPILLFSYFDLATYSWWQHNAVRELCTFVGREVIQRSHPGDMQCVAHKEHICHSRITNKNLAVTVLTDQEYPKRVAFDFIKKALELFLKDVPEPKWINETKDQTLKIPSLEGLVTQYQNPVEADKILKIQTGIDETKNILLKSIDQMLERGERLEDLAQRSNDLSFQSKAFLGEANKMNRCCTIL